MMLKCLIFLLLAVGSLHSTGAFVIKDCTKNADPDAKLAKVLISSCPNADGNACRFKRGENATITINFKSVKPFSHADVMIRAKFGIFSIPFPIKPSDACGNYGFNCPVKADQDLQFELSLPLLKSYPAIKAGLTLQLLDQDKHPIICIQLPVQLY